MVGAEQKQRVRACLGGRVRPAPARCWFVVALTAALLSSAACTPLQPRFEGFADIDFRVRGRIGVRSGDEAFSASFDWRQAGDRFAIELWGLMGQGRTLLLSDGRRLRVIDSRGKVVEDEDMDALMLRTLGWRAPVAALRHWVRGQLAPGPAVALAQDEDGRLTGFQQLGWSVELRRWRSTTVGEVPAKIVAKREGRRVTVVCKEWFGPR